MRGKKGVAICTHAPLAIPNSNFLTWHRFVEWMEYQIMIGIDVIIMPYPMKISKFPLPDEIDRALHYYVKKGHLRMMDLPYYREGHSGITQESNAIYRISSWSKLFHMTHCYLKHALEFEHILSLDLDEVPGFHADRPPNISEAISSMKAALGSSGAQKSFQMRDRIMIVSSVCTKHLKLDTSWQNGTVDEHFAILNARYAYAKAYHPGKQIINTDVCVFLHLHGCDSYLPISEKEHFKAQYSFDSINKPLDLQIANESGIYLNHYRTLKCEKSNLESCCLKHGDEIQDNFNLNNIRLLKKRIRTVAAELNFTTTLRSDTL